MNSINSITLNKNLPKYGYPIDKSIIALDDSKLMATLRLNGISFEVESDQNLENSFNKVKEFLNQLSKTYGHKMAVWTHIVKRKDSLDAEYSFKNNFVEGFTKKYLTTFKKNKLFRTEYYITFVYDYKDSLDNAMADFNDLIKMSSSVLKEFNCTVLSINEDGTRCENIEFLSYIINNDNRKIPLSSTKIVEKISHSDWHFGYDVLEIRNSDSIKSKYATFYELNSFPLCTTVGMLDFVLNQQSEFVLTQSMILMKSAQTISLLDKQINLISSSDNSEHELNEINTARNYVATGEISFGDYHCSLAVYGESVQNAIENGNSISSEFLARGAILKRSNLTSQFSFLSALPSSKIRIKSSPRTTTNLACSFSLHNHSQGKKEGNPIGDGSALIPLKTTSGTIFYLNCHASEINKNVTGQKYAGHTLILGASGTGKTTLEGTIAAFATRYNPQIFAIDYNRSTELFMRSFGAEYFTIAEGQDTGLNPFQLRKTPKLISFLNRLVCSLCKNSDGVVDEFEEMEIKKGIDNVMKLDNEKRCLSTLLQQIISSSLRTRLSKWCRASQGKLSWCLDSKYNKFDPLKMDKVGFDSTVLLDGNGHEASEPILATLFFLKELMQIEGRLCLTIVEEFWMPANFTLTQNIMKKILKAGRLKNEFMILSSQSPEDAINCEIFSAIVQQTPTKIFLPNPDAEFESYKRCNVNENEFFEMKKLDRLSRTFLVKQSNTSCFCKLDLHGFDEFLPIISGSFDDITLSESYRKKYGEDPEKWIPEFQKFLVGDKELK